MSLNRRHVAAVVGATLTSLVALSDAIMRGATGRNLLPSDDSGPVGWLVAGDLLHGLTYAALSWVLAGERTRFAHGTKFVRALRRVLLVSLAILGAGFVLVAPALAIAHVAADSPLAAGWGWIAGIGFAGMILAALLLGIAVLRSNPLGHGGRILGLLIAVLPVTVLLGVARSDWAHPGYVETVIYLGVALIGVGAEGGGTAQRSRVDRQQTARRDLLVDTPYRSQTPDLGRLAPTSKTSGEPTTGDGAAGS